MCGHSLRIRSTARPLLAGHTQIQATFGPIGERSAQWTWRMPVAVPTDPTAQWDNTPIAIDAEAHPTAQYRSMMQELEHRAMEAMGPTVLPQHTGRGAVLESVKSRGPAL